MEDQTTYSMPRIGDRPPRSPQRPPRRHQLPADYEGGWVILFSHPADFTPVCTSEFMTFAVMEEQFAKYNTKLVGCRSTASTAIMAAHHQEKMTYRDWKNVEVKFRSSTTCR